MNIKKIIKPIITLKSPQGPQEGSSRVNRGGSWYNHAQGLRSANRLNDSPGKRYNDLGFRLVRTPRHSYPLTLDKNRTEQELAIAQKSLQEIEQLLGRKL